MAITFKGESVPNLSEGQRAFRFDTGEIFVVQISRIEPKPEDAQINMKVEAFRANEDGSIVIENGTPQKIPAHIHSINTAALADGQVIVENEIANETVKAAERLRNHLAALKAWAKIPTMPDSSPIGATTSMSPSK